MKQLLLSLEAASSVAAGSDSLSSKAQGVSIGQASSTSAKTASSASSVKDSLRGSNISSATAPEATLMPQQSIGSNTAAGGTAAAPQAEAAARRTPVPPKLPELVSGHYLLDFGCVAKGINKSRKVKLTNMSTQQVGERFVVCCS